MKIHVLIIQLLKELQEWRNKENLMKANMMYDLVNDPNENTNISKNKESPASKWMKFS